MQEFEVLSYVSDEVVTGNHRLFLKTLYHFARVKFEKPFLISGRILGLEHRLSLHETLLGVY